MRDIYKVLPSVLGALQDNGLKRNEAEQLCLVELGLCLAETITPDIAVADAWTLFSGYPFAKALGLVTEDGEALLQTARYSLWNFGRSQSWQDALDVYERFPSTIRAYTWPNSGSPAERQPVTAASDRWDEYGTALRQAPPFAGEAITVATNGSYQFFAGRNSLTVHFPKVPTRPFSGHDLDSPLTGDGYPLEIRWDALIEAAEEMDEQAPRDRAGVLRTVQLFVAAQGGFARGESFSIDGVSHLLGIVGAGKSTLRDVLTYYLVKHFHPRRRVTVVVGDVAEMLVLVELFRTLKCRVAPVLGASNREQHAQRLHRRLAGRGQPNALRHDDSSFDFLSTACAVSGLLDDDDAPLAYADAPCTRLHPKRKRLPPDGSEGELPPYTRARHGCPFWGRCPRHHGARELAEADIWVATPASLVDSPVPWPQNPERLRYVELAARRSDLIIVDEADRVQMQLDRIFAPAITLAGEESTSWLDDVNTHKIRELVTGRRTQLSNRDVENWTSALNTATAVTDRLYAMLVGNWDLRKWVSGSYFNAWKLHGRLVDHLFPNPSKGKPDRHVKARQRVLQILEDFRKNPFGDKGVVPPPARGLVALTNELLHTSRSKSTSTRVHGALWSLLGRRKSLNQLDDLVEKFELTLLLSALEPTLALMTGMWPRVQAALNLGFNHLHRRPLDYGPMVPESPMGNVLGFEFLINGPDKGGIRSGELRFFRCSGVGRSLLTTLPRLAEVDGRPGTHVLLMSGSSWAGRSSRYHVLAPVDVILKPEQKRVDRITDESSLRLEFVEHKGTPLTLSGARLADRPAILRTMAFALATRLENQPSRLERELADLSEHRRHLLVLTGSYDEAKVVADAMHSTGLKGRVIRLLADDERDPVADESSAPVLRRGDVSRLRHTQARVLVAPLLAVERAHNIMTACGEAAIGTVYFLARPNPRPDDLGLAIHAINDWITRAVADTDDGFDKWVVEAATIGDAGRVLRSRAYKEWYRVLGRHLAWSRLGDDRTTLTWDLLVLMWQVIGRLVRGGVEARVVLVDAAFAPKTAEALSKNAMPGKQVLITDHDTPETSLLLSIHQVLGDCLASTSQRDRELAQALYSPLWQMIDRCIRQPTTGGKPW